MKFEHVLQIYWSKGFLFTTRLIPFDTSLKNFLVPVGGLGWSTKEKFIKRFELIQFTKNRNLSLITLDPFVRKAINILLSLLTSVNNQIGDLVRLYIIRLYLTKTTRGRAQALGKPSRGQRTWSNAWTAYRRNTVLRHFIVETQRLLKPFQKVEKINYKILQKKSKIKTTKNPLKKQITKKNKWF